MTLSLNITSPLPAGMHPGQFLQALTETQHELSSDLEGQVNLAFVSEAQARQLNHQYAHNNYATDVLSFDYFESSLEPAKSEDERGEVIICLPVAERQAEEHGTSLDGELLLLFVHGVLHLHGLDHDDEQKTSFADHQNAIMDRLTESHRDIFA